MKAFKIIKIYFYFLVILLSLAGSSYNPAFKEFYIKSGEKVIAYATDIKRIGEMRIHTANVLDHDKGFNKATDLDLSLSMSDDIFIEFEKIKDEDKLKNFIRNGESGVSLFKIKMKSFDKEVFVNKIILSASGLSEGQISDVYLEDSENKIYSSEKEGLVFSFQHSIKIESNSKKTLTLKANLADNLSVNQRIRFDILNASDIECLIDGEKQYPKAIYPIEGPYISIVGEKIKAITKQ